MKKLLIILAAVFAATISAQAASVAISTTAPTTDGDDISNLATSTGGDNVWSDRRMQGQTFLTNAAGASELNSFTFQLLEGDGTILGHKTYRVRVGTIATGIFTPFFDEATQSPDTDTATMSYFTYNFTTALALAANTTYAIEIGISASQNGYQDGIPSATKTGDVYAGGEKYQSGANQNTYSNLETSTVSFASGNDLVFALDMSVVPEPSSTALIGLGGLALILRRRR
jgi:hypothetical protein